MTDTDTDDDLRSLVYTTRQVIRDRAAAIIARLYTIERDSDSTADDWQSNPLAVEYRMLLCEWWSLPSALTQNALYGDPTGSNQYHPTPQSRSFANRQLTAKGLLRPSLTDKYSRSLLEAPMCIPPVRRAAVHDPRD